MFKDRYRQLLIICILLLFAGTANAQNYMLLWPKNKMPNSKGIAVQDSIHNQRIYRHKYPGMYAFFPSHDDNKGSAVVIFPGGGYQHLTYVLSGTQLAKWCNVMGMSAFVVNYRLPNNPDLEKRQIGPLQDAQRAMRIIRANAKQWGINPDKIGVLGTSAGGHLASTLGTHLHQDVSTLGDSLDQYSYKPDFMILISPVISMGKYAHAGSRDNLLGPNPSKALRNKYSNELQVTDETPPTFLANAFNDHTVDPHNELMFYRALLEHNISTSFHVFPQGGHGLNVRNNPGSGEYWTDLCEAWLKEMGYLQPLNKIRD